MKLIITILLTLISTQIIAIDYTVPSRKLASDAVSISHGTGLFSDTSNSLLDIDADITPSLETQAFFAEIIQDNRLLIGSAKVPIKNIQFGLGFVQAGVTNLVKTEQTGADNEHVSTGQTYSYKHNQAKVSLAYKLSNNVSIGSGINYFVTEMDTVSGSGFGLDAGLKYQLTDRNLLAVSIQNVLSNTITFQSGSETLPLTFNLGIENKINDSLTARAYTTRITKSVDTDNDVLLGAGLSYQLVPQLRLHGSWFQRDSIIDKHSFFGLGTDLTLGSLSLQYSFRSVEYKAQSNQHFFSIGLKIN